MSGTGTVWTIKELKQHFFVYNGMTDASDLLHEIKVASVSKPEVQVLACGLYERLRSTAHAASTPFFTAMLGGAEGRNGAVKNLLTEAQKGNKDALKNAVQLLMDSPNSLLDAPFETMRLVHERAGLLEEAFQALLRQATAMAWSAFEVFCFESLRLVFISDFRFLNQAVAAISKGSAWGTRPQEILKWMQAQTSGPSAVSPADAFDTCRDVATMTLKATRHFSGVFFAGDSALLALLDEPALKRLSARRHLLMHSAGIVDADFVANSGETLAVGTSLTVTPAELELEFAAASRAGAALARATAGVL